MNQPEFVILVNERDEPTGQLEKMAAHQQGLLHRAFSVFIFTSRGEMLLQRRALQKYHSAGLWTNACCSHPRPGEPVGQAAERRLREELGFVAPLTPIFDFIYHARFDNGLTEHEFDHVFAGRYDGPVRPDPGEVAEVAFRSMDQIREELAADPGQYTAWFRIAFPRLEDWWRAQVDQEGRLTA
ncbi:MAG TPA: isopentenyl-diphosphate Delta-isomerase [Chitinophagaceae bacterium]|nr:isopentenyl-diphosphate Delta-isomerase [Chitinophagaceae bacterium]